MSTTNHPERAHGILHFFPGAKRILWIVHGKVVVSGEAWGGEDPVPGVNYGKMKPRRTTAGHYIIHSYAPYTTRTWATSQIRWGTEIQIRQFDVGGKTVERVFIRHGHKRPVWSPAHFKSFPSPDQIREWYKVLYGGTGLYDSNHDNVPDSWVFGDFGPMAVRYFRDRNHDGVLDDGEQLMGELIHTTPINEAEAIRKLPIKYEPSHGCIHISPADRDRFKKAGAFQRGNRFIVHRYGESLPANLSP